MRDGGLQSTEQIGKIEWITDLDLKFYYFLQNDSTLQNSYVNDIFCLNRSTNNTCSVLDLLTWRWPPPLSFSCLFFEKAAFILCNKTWWYPHQEEENKSQTFTLYYIGLMVLLRLNYILLLSSLVRHSSWRDADFAAFLVSLWNLHKNTNSQIQCWAFEHPCSRSFCAHRHCCPESERNSSQTSSRRFSRYWRLCKSLHTVQSN